MKDIDVLNDINDLLAGGSTGFQLDSMEMLDFVTDLKDGDFSPDPRLNKQLKVCAVIASFLAWATVNREDYETIVHYWNKHVAPRLTHAMKKRNSRET